MNRSWNVIVVSVRGKPVIWPDKEDKMLQELTKDYKKLVWFHQQCTSLGV